VVTAEVDLFQCNSIIKNLKHSKITMTEKNGKPQYAEDNLSQKFTCNRSSLTEIDIA